MGESLGLKKILMSVEGLDTREMLARNQIDQMVRNTDPWSGSKDQQNKTDMIYQNILWLYFSIVKIFPLLVLR